MSLEPSRTLLGVSIFQPFEAGGYEFAGVGCSFCGRLVESGLVDPVTLTVQARSDRSRKDGFGIQTLWCHAECLAAAGIRELHVTRPEYWEDIGPDD